VFTPSRCCVTSSGPNAKDESELVMVRVTREPGISTKLLSPGLWSPTQMANTNGEESTVTSSVPLMPMPSMQLGTVMEMTVLPVAAYEDAGASAETASIAAAESQPSRRRVPPRRRGRA
jgi:hypothetical protein